MFAFWAAFADGLRLGHSLGKIKGYNKLGIKLALSLDAVQWLLFGVADESDDSIRLLIKPIFSVVSTRREDVLEQRRKWLLLIGDLGDSIMMRRLVDGG